MKKNIFLILVILFIANCANLEFVYKLNSGLDDLKNNTKVIIVGDDAIEIFYSIKNILGNINKQDSDYILKISSIRKDLAQVIEKDATASKFSIEYNISYSLFNLEQNCEIIDSQNLTKGFYDSKSAGYSFGTDLSKKETEKKLISRNIDQFVSSIYRYGDLNSCHNEN